ncbi:leucine-rich repeat protein kinase family protein [Striga asiatica]|uniref:Leucine-rich repeat protein kinase family protein n=1 Tax=Striga asiatica TaxID=4170 RepID=A0A5A7QWB7_STRAF|nr:leucine-rich repeat protein kinase family protein [Striga asiatica]
MRRLRASVASCSDSRGGSVRGGRKYGVSFPVDFSFSGRQCRALNPHHRLVFTACESPAEIGNRSNLGADELNPKFHRQPEINIQPSIPSSPPPSDEKYAGTPTFHPEVWKFRWMSKKGDIHGEESRPGGLIVGMAEHN